MAGGAEGGIEDLFADGGELARVVEHGHGEGLFVGAVDLVFGVDAEAAGEGFGLAEAGGFDLVADGAGDAFDAGFVEFGEGERLVFGAEGVLLHGGVAAEALVLDGGFGGGGGVGLELDLGLPVGVLGGVGHHGAGPEAELADGGGVVAEFAGFGGLKEVLLTPDRAGRQEDREEAHIGVDAVCWKG
ncbi:MAG: hypothetical protein VKK43_02855 [Synechococcaceae cyanobacterium]|nr:hypothetical protein [Synechococcaceae cyanobacterium]